MDYTLELLDPEGETLDRLEGRTGMEWGTQGSGLTTYRDYEQAAMAVTYFEGEPVMTEEPAIEWDAYPASWDEPVLHFSNTTYLDFTTRRGSGGNFPDRQAKLEYMQLRADWEADVASESCYCPLCGGELLDMNEYTRCDTCEYGRMWS
jgi:hypothetical protein